MDRRRVGRVIVALSFALAVAHAFPAHADSILFVDGVEIWRVAGPIGAGETRRLAPTDVVVSPLVVIHGLSVAVTNDGGTRGGIEIVIDTFEWGVGLPPTQEPPSTTVLFMQDFTIAPHTDVARVDLFSHCCAGELSGDPLQFVRIDKRVQVQSVPLDLSDVITGATPFSGATAGGTTDLPKESVSLNFAKVEFEYKPQTDGKKLELKQFKSRDTWRVPEPSMIALIGVAAVGLLGYACKAPKCRLAARPRADIRN